jgi:hypothetical protein
MKTAVWGRIAALFVLFLCGYCFGAPRIALAQYPPDKATYQKDLGDIGAALPDTAAQCRHLLAMMAEQPGKQVYRLAYQDATHRHYFEANLKRHTISRSHHGTGRKSQGSEIEVWLARGANGYGVLQDVAARLKKADSTARRSATSGTWCTRTDNNLPT